MTIETGLKAHLVADGAVNADVAGRIYPLKLPQEPTYPAITYEVVGDTRHRDLSGPGDRERPHFRVHCWAATYAAALDLAADVRTALDGFKGTMDTTEVSSVKFDGWNDQFEDVPEVYRRICDFVIAHT